MSDEIFVLTVTLYGKARIQYVINGSGIVAFACQVSAAVTGRVGYGIACISQIALHVSQSGQRSSGTCRILHAGNYVAGRHFVTACRCVIEFAVGSFVHLRAVCFGIYNRKLGILHHGLGVDGVGVALVAVGVHILFYSQSVTGCKGYFLTRFNSSRCSVGAASQITARCGLEAAFVDGIGNVAGSGQFIDICTSRSNYFASGIAAGTITYVQRSGISCYRVSRTASGCIHHRCNANTITGGYLTGSSSLSSF